MNKTAAEISHLKNNSRQAVNKFISKNKIAPSGRKGKFKTYDCLKEPLASYLSGKAPHAKQNPDFSPPEQLEENIPNLPNTKAVSRISKPLNDLLSGKMPEGKKPSSWFYLRAMEIAQENKDAGLLAKLGQIADKEERDDLYQQQMLKTEQAKEQFAQEKAARLKLENDIRRGQFMDMSTVKLIFGKFYAIHNTMLTPLSLKLSSMLASVPEGNKKEATMKKLINDEIYAALESIKRILVDFVLSGDDAAVDKI